MAELINESEFEITGALKKENHLKKSLLVLSRKEVTIVRYLELPKSDTLVLIWNCYASCYGTASSKMVWWWWWWCCTTNMAGLVLNAPHSGWFVNFSILTSCQLQRVTFGRITHSKLFYTSAKHKSLTWNRPRVLVHNQHARELISDQKMSQSQQQRPKSPMVTCGVFTLQAQVTYGNLHLQGKNSTKNSRSVELCTTGDSGLC